MDEVFLTIKGEQHYLWRAVRPLWTVIGAGALLIHCRLFAMLTPSTRRAL
jgi:hypothetical protein